jgi:5-methylcytosine-specific restriction endonuclease McrA
MRYHERIRIFQQTGTLPSSKRRGHKSRPKGKCCVYCKTEYNLTRDHVIPLSKGGLNRIDNIVLACFECNQAKGDMLPLNFIWSRL